MILRGKGLALLRLTTVSVVALAVFFLFGIHPTYAAGNSDMSFEGKIVSNTGVNIPDASYNMEFKIYTGCTNEPTSSTGCTAVWTEDWLVGSNPVTTTSGTFQVNLGSICPLGSTTTCEGNTESSIPWDSSPLYLSMQIGNTSTCTTVPPGANFTADCGGDNAMNPYIELTAAPYAQDAGLLGGISSAGYGQLADTSTETWSGDTNIFQPSSLNVPSVQILQNKSGSFGQDVFDVQGSSGGTNNFIQVTSTAANQGAVNISALGGTTTGNAVTITGGAATGANVGGTVSLVGGVASATTAGSTGGPISLQAGNGTSFTTGGAGGSITITSGSAGGNATVAENAGTVSIDTGTNIDGGSGTINLGGTNATAINLGNTGATTTETLKGGSSLESLSSSGADIQSTTNSQNAFQVENAAGSPILQVDTTSTDPAGATVNYLTYPGFEVPNGSQPQGWTGVGTGTLTQNTNQQYVYNGDDSAKVAGTATGAGLSTTSFNSAPPAHTYIVSFYVYPSGTTITPSEFTVSVTGTSTQTCSPAGTTALPTTGFTQLYCQVAATSAAVTSMQITETLAGSTTIYYDGAQLQSTTFNGAAITAPSGYQIGGVQLRGILENPIDIEPQSNSTSAFQVQSSAGSDIFNIDNLNQIVEVGSQTSNSNAVILQLDSYNTFADPTTTTCSTTSLEGGMYYNTATNAVRACIGGSWTDLASSAALGLLAYGVVSTSGGTGNAGDLASTTTASISGPCKVSWASATTVTVQPCLAYSGGRQVAVGTTIPGYSGAQTISLTGLTTTDRYANLCFATTAGAASSTLALVGAGNAGSTSLTASTIEPTWNAGAPILCLATIVNGTAANGSFATGGMIYDTRTFVETVKMYAASTSAMALSTVVEPYTTAGEVEKPTATGVKVAGVVVASNGATETGGAPNVIIATSGPAEVQTLSGATVTIGDSVEADGAAGQAEAASAGVATAYANLGQAVTTSNSGGACTTAASCVGALLLNVDIGYE